jgi:photosystem II stability/assembly factor-like uncharacterized protein
MLRYALRPGRLVGLLGFLLLAFGFFGADTAHAQTPAPDWSPTFPREGGTGFEDVDCVGERCVAVNMSGQIAVTTDGGFDWRSVPSPVSVSAVYTNFPAYFDWLYTVECPSTTICYTAGLSGFIAKSSDGGETWVKQQNSLLYAIRKLSCPNAQECYATGRAYLPNDSYTATITSGGYLLRTTNGGESWVRVSNVPTATGYTLVCPASNICYLNGYKTTDGGATWTPLSTVSNILYCVDQNLCFGSGNSKTYRTSDGGTSWTPIFEGSFSKMFCTSAQICYGYRFSSSYSGSSRVPQAIFTTKDGGTSWQNNSYNLSIIVNAITCIDADRCIAVGGIDASGVGYYSPLIVGTLDAGKNWTKRNESLNKPLQSVSCPTEQICYTVGARGTIFKTTDNSFSWYEQSTPLSTTLFSIACQSATFCVAVGDLGKIRYTTDGTNWNTAPAFDNTPLYNINCPATDECVAVGRGGLILRMNGTPISWVQENSGTNSMLFAVSCPATGTCYATGENGTLLKKSGGTWTPQVSGSSKDLRAISCPALTNCYVTENANSSGIGGRIISTTNGTSWAASSTGFLGSGIASIACPNISLCFVGNNYSRVLSLTNGNRASDWYMDSEKVSELPAEQVLSISCFSATRCVGVGTNNLITQTYDGAKGLTWESRNTFYYSLYRGTCPTGSTTCITTGQHGLVGGIMTSQDSGKTWKTTFFPKMPLLTHLSCPTNQICYASNYSYSYQDESTSLIKTTNAGNSWQFVTSTVAVRGGISCATTEICLGSDNTCGPYSATCGGSPTVWRSTNGGVTWISSTLGYHFELTCVSSQICYASGKDSNSIYKTTNQGVDWSLLSSPAISGAISSFSCASEQACYFLVGPVGFDSSDFRYKVLKTLDGGANWEVKDIPKNSLITSFNTISCASISHCLAGGVGGLLIATRNGGDNWQALPNRAFSVYGYTECQADRTCRVFGEGA